MQTSFTLDDINRAHEGASQSTVADYLAKLRDLGVVSYATYIADGHSEYVDAAGNRLASTPIYQSLDVSDRVDRSAARRALEAHSCCETDYFAFTRQLAAAGVNTWVMDPVAMTCAFCDRTGEPLFIEDI